MLALTVAATAWSCGPSDGGVIVPIDTDGPAVAEVDVSPATAQVLEVGATVTFAAVPRDASGAEVTDATVTWSSSDVGVAVVDRDGVATAVGPGQTNIVAEAGNASGAAVLTVSLVTAVARAERPTASHTPGELP